jgi:hypothetical protein
MGSSGRFRLKRLGSLKIFVALEDGSDQTGEKAAAGSIVIFRRNAKRPSVYETIYDAWRSRLEIIDRYGSDGREAGEITELIETRERLQTAGLDLHDEDGGAAGGRLTRRIGRVAKDLRHKSNPLKSEARCKAQAGPVRTSKNRRVNRMATQARVTAIDSRLAERQEEIYSILPWMQAMETALRLEIDRCLGIIGRLARDVGTIRCGHEFFRTGRTTPNQLKGLGARLRLAQNSLGTLEAAPFREAGRYLQVHLAKAIEQVLRGDARLAAYWLGHVSTKCAAAKLQRAVEDIVVTASLMAVTGGLTATALSDLTLHVDLLLEKVSFPQRTGAVTDIAPHLRSARVVIQDCRGLWSGRQTEQAAARLEEFRQALKDVSRRLSR